MRRLTLLLGLIGFALAQPYVWQTIKARQLFVITRAGDTIAWIDSLGYLHGNGSLLTGIIAGEDTVMYADSSGVAKSVVGENTDTLVVNFGWGIDGTYADETLTVEADSDAIQAIVGGGSSDSSFVWAAIDSGSGNVAQFTRGRFTNIFGEGSNITAVNAATLQGKDTTALWNAKTLQGKDTNTVHVYVGRDSAAAQKGDSLLGGQLTVSNVAAIANVGNTVIITNTPAVGTVLRWGTGLSDFIWHTSSYAGHNPADTLWVACQYAGVGGDTMKWKLGRTGTYAKWIITAAKKAFSVGCSTTVAATTGHTVGDSWAVPVSAPVPLLIKHSNGTIFGKIFPDGATQWGYGNTASGSQTTVGGGNSNTASGVQATVGGGNNNTASGVQATVGGGNNNVVKGSLSVIPGGVANLDSAPYSFALGCSLRNKATDSMSGVIGFGAGADRLVSDGKRTITMGVTAHNVTLYDDDSVVHWGKTVAKAAVTWAGSSLMRFDSLTYAADTSTCTIWFGSKHFTISATP